MPTPNDTWEEISFLRNLLQQKDCEIIAIGNKLCDARQELDDTRRDNRNLKAEVERLQVEVRDERDARRTAERSLRIANDALAVHRQVQNVGVEMAAALSANRNGRNPQ